MFCTLKYKLIQIIWLKQVCISISASDRGLYKAFSAPISATPWSDDEKYIKEVLVAWSVGYVHSTISSSRMGKTLKTFK